MGVVTFSQEFTSVVGPARLFNAMILDCCHVLPKIVPEIKSMEFIKGDGEAGSIMKTNFGESSHIKYTKHRIIARDKLNFYCKFSMIESNVKFDKIDSIVNKVVLAKTDDGCICKITTTCHSREGVELSWVDLKEGIDILQGLFKAVEGYLVEHPDLSA